MKKMLIVLFIIGILLSANITVYGKFQGFYLSDKVQISESLKKEIFGKTSKIKDLEPGDILFHISQYITIHCLIFKQYNLNNETYEFIEANSDEGVRRIFYIESTLNNTIIYKKFARVKTANSKQIENAILFAESQIGKQFEWDMFFHNKNYIPNDSKYPYSKTWYCTELVWAAYYNCNHSPEEKIYGEGIDIDRNEWIKDSLLWSMVWPNNILWDDDVEVFYLWKIKNHLSFNKILINLLTKSNILNIF